MRRLRLLHRPVAFLRDRRGVAAVEFALILPVMILSYVGVSELSSAMMAQRRVSHSASALGDMIAQYQSIQKSDAASVFNAAALIMAPFDSSAISLRMTEFTYASNGKATVVWTQMSGPKVWSETYTPPTKTAPGETISNASARDAQVTSLLTASGGGSLVLSEAQYTYNSPITYAVSSALPKAFTFNDAFYLSPRSGGTIACSDC